MRNGKQKTKQVQVGGEPNDEPSNCQGKTFALNSKYLKNAFQAPDVADLGPSMERRTLMSNVQPAPLSYEDLANQVSSLEVKFDS